MRDKCDELASEITCAAGSCQRCGKTYNLTCSHILARRYAATRCDLDNLQCLCLDCHRYFTDNPAIFNTWLDASVGSFELARLRGKAYQVTKVDWAVEKVRLQAIARELKLKI